MVCVHASLPSGRPRPRLVLIASRSFSCSDWLTHRVQSRGRSTGHSDRIDFCWASPRSLTHKLLHRHSSARPTSPAATGFRSTYRHNVSRWSSCSTGKLLNRPRGSYNRGKETGTELVCSSRDLLRPAFAAEGVPQAKTRGDGLCPCLAPLRTRRSRSSDLSGAEN